MVRLDDLIGLGAALDDIGIYRALCEEVDAVEFSRFFFKYSYKFRTDDLSLLFGIFDACELVEESVHAVGIYKRRAQFFSEYSDDLFRLSLSEKSVVDVHADELFAYRLDEERGNDRAVNAAGEREEYLFVAYLLSEKLDLIVDEVLHIPVGICFAGIENERSEIALLDRGALVCSVTQRNDGNARFVYIVRNVYLHAVYNVVGAAA